MWTSCTVVNIVSTSVKNMAMVQVFDIMSDKFKALCKMKIDK
jgi:hypothetical protein